MNTDESKVESLTADQLEKLKQLREDFQDAEARGETTSSKTLEGHFKVLDLGKEPTWGCNLFGGGNDGIVWYVVKPPFILWRWMQFICFGSKWKKIKK